MRREDLIDLNAFMTIAEERSFTRAAAKLGTSQSTLSHTIRRLEARVGVRLLTRTTRSVAPTEAGERLLLTLQPALESIGSGLISLGDLRDRPSGMVRITTSEHAARTVLWPRLARVMSSYPDVQIELSVDSSLTDIVAERFDAGVRLGEALEKDMVAVRIGPDVRLVIVASPNYLDGRAPITTPQDLSDHNCINQRMRSSGGLYSWELAKEGREIRVRVGGQMVCDNIGMIVEAAADGVGLAFVMEDRVEHLIAEGRLVRVLDDWCPPFAGYHLYYPSRRQMSAAFSVVVDALRYRAS